jgi:hypothetical protein
VALLTALGLAGVSGFFSIVGLTTIFLGSFWPVVGMGSAFEGAKLSAVALLGQGRVASRALKFAIVTLIAALMKLNIVGAYGFLARPDRLRGRRRSPGRGSRCATRSLRVRSGHDDPEIQCPLYS